MEIGLIIKWTSLIVMLSLFILNIWSERKKIFLYKFFALRDRLYRLAIEGKIKEGSISYKRIELLLNITIALHNKLKFKDYLRFISNKESNKPSSDYLIKDLKKQDQEVIDIVVEFSSLFIKLLLMNSPFLWFALQVYLSLNRISHRARKIAESWQTLKWTLNAYDSCEDFRNKLRFT